MYIDDKLQVFSIMVCSHTSASSIRLKALAMEASIPTMSNSMVFSSMSTMSILKFYNNGVVRYFNIQPNHYELNNI